MADAMISVEKIKAFYHSQIHDPDKWDLNKVIFILPLFCLRYRLILFIKKKICRFVILFTIYLEIEYDFFNSIKVSDVQLLLTLFAFGPKLRPVLRIYLLLLFFALEIIIIH